jgi:hypothetical protein
MPLHRLELAPTAMENSPPPLPSTKRRAAPPRPVASAGATAPWGPTPARPEASTRFTPPYPRPAGALTRVTRGSSGLRARLMESTVKSILNSLRNHCFVRPMTEEEAKSISLELLRPMVREHELAMKAALDDEDSLSTLLHLGWMSLYAVKTSLTWRSILLHLRLFVGSKQERTAILIGCLDASFELMRKNPNSSQEPTIH